MAWVFWDAMPRSVRSRNARLIAAAPNMLRALKRADKALEKAYGANGTLDPTNAVYRDMKAVKAAIAKAEGEAK